MNKQNNKILPADKDNITLKYLVRTGAYTSENEAGRDAMRKGLLIIKREQEITKEEIENFKKELQEEEIREHNRKIIKGLEEVSK